MCVNWCLQRTLTFRGGLRSMLLEGAAFESAEVHPEAVRVDISSQDASLADSLAAGAGGAGARLETSFAQSSRNKVCSLSQQRAGCQLRVTGLTPSALLSHAWMPQMDRRSASPASMGTCVCRWCWPAACWWMRWAASAPLQRRRAAAGSRTAWCSWWAAARRACPGRAAADLLYSFVPLNKCVLQFPLFHVRKT